MTGIHAVTAALLRPTRHDWRAPRTRLDWPSPQTPLVAGSTIRCYDCPSNALTRPTR
jgi:hypothetical protein